MAGKVVAARNRVPLVVIPTALDSDAAIRWWRASTSRTGTGARRVEETGPVTDVIIDWEIIRLRRRTSVGGYRGCALSGHWFARLALRRAERAQPDRPALRRGRRVAAGLASQAKERGGHRPGQPRRAADAARPDDDRRPGVQPPATRGPARAEHYLAQILAGIAPEIPHSALVGPCLLLVSALHGQSPAALREALEAAGIRLDAVRPTDVRLVLDNLPDYLDAYDFPYSILNDIDPESEMVDRALEAAGLAVQPETWEVPSEASAALGIGAPGGPEADLGETRPADQPEDDLGSEQPLNG